MITELIEKFARRSAVVWQRITVVTRRGASFEMDSVLLNLEKNFGEGWKPAEQSCVIYSIAYDSDHLVIKSFRINGSG